MTRPWEAAPARPWEKAGVAIYPRTIAITRPASAQSTSGGAASAPASQVGGSVPYIGLREPTATGGTSEPTIATGIPASIQALGSRVVAPLDALASSAAGPIRWKIFIPASALAKGAIRDRDIVTDDEGNRYDVSAAYWNSLGYALETVRLEA